MSKSNTTIAPSRKGRKNAAPTPTPRRRKASPSTPGDLLVAELRDWLDRARALPGDPDADPAEWHRAFLAKMMAAFVAQAVAALDTWNGPDPRPLRLSFGFSPARRLPDDDGPPLYATALVRLEQEEPRPVATRKGAAS